MTDLVASDASDTVASDPTDLIAAGVVDQLLAAEPTPVSTREPTREPTADWVAARAVIEQAKGVLMLAYGVDDTGAFAMLRWWSRQRNVKVRDLADRLIEHARAGRLSTVSLRGQLDALLHDLTVPVLATDRP